MGQRPYEGQAPFCFRSLTARHSLAAHRAAEPAGKVLLGQSISISPEKDRTGTRPVNLYVTRRATRVLRILVVRWTSRLIGPDAVVHAVARQT